MTTSVKNSFPAKTSTASGIFKTHGNNPGEPAKHKDVQAYALNIPGKPPIGQPPSGRTKNRNKPNDQLHVKHTKLNASHK